MLRTIRSQGQALAVRRTGPTARDVRVEADERDAGDADDGGAAAGAARVHLVGTAAGPMGGDVVEVRLRVGPGARLEVAGVAATVVLPSRSQPRSELVLEVDVAAGGMLVCTLPPVVVTGRAELVARTRVRLVGDGRVRLVEHVRLGRHDEAGGWWRGRLDVTRDAVPVLRQTTTLGDDPDDGLRDLRSVLDTADPTTADPTGDGRRSVVLRPAGGGSLVITLGRSGEVRCHNDDTQV